MKTLHSIILPLCAAGTLTLSSCVVVPYDSGYVNGGSVGYYETLPTSWNRPYYYYGNRYYYGGRCETGRYHYSGHYYDSRYYHNGHYYYGGRYCEPSRNSSHSSSNHPHYESNPYDRYHRY